MEFLYKLPRLRMISSLAVRDLSNLVEPEELQSIWQPYLRQFHNILKRIGPQILRKLHEDNEYALYTVTLFSHDTENLEPRHAKEFSEFAIEHLNLAPYVKSEKKVRSISKDCVKVQTAHTGKLRTKEGLVVSQVLLMHNLMSPSP
ncbi:V-type proton ATPase subunit C-like [Forsythia ovata]|uniref:V-type proton ATPase subunit C-like n=1 Tax=Forsythia ovata TaxID=205694 RepID=A0ABD1P7C3_9LAMI